MNTEAEFHNRIKTVLSKKQQGIVMGMFRDVTRQHAIDKHNAQHVLNQLTKMSAERDELAALNKSLLAERSGCLTAPIKLTENQIAIFGRPNFLCSPIAKLLISHGIYERGPNKAEYEQAVCVHWCSGLLQKHGDDWRGIAKHILKDLENTNPLSDQS